MNSRRTQGCGSALTSQSDDPFKGAQVYLYGPDGKLKGTATTDEDGWYFFSYKHTGKAVTFTIKIIANGKTMTKTLTLKANGYVQVELHGSKRKSKISLFFISSFCYLCNLVSAPTFQKMNGQGSHAQSQSRAAFSWAGSVGSVGSLWSYLSVSWSRTILGTAKRLLLSVQA